MRHNPAPSIAPQAIKGRVVAVQHLREQLLAGVEQSMPEEAAEYRYVHRQPAAAMANTTCSAYMLVPA